MPGDDTITATIDGRALTTSVPVTVVQPPTIGGFSPASGALGSKVVLTGANLGGATSVRFNGTTAPTFTVNSPTQITVTVPVGATSGVIEVSTPGGTAMSTASFTVLQPPTIGSFSPASGALGSTIVLTGANLAGATFVSFNGTTARTFTVNSPTQITVTVPVGASSGFIVVSTPGGKATSITSFTVFQPPSIASFSPAHGAIGNTVILTGANFGGTATVSFNGTTAPSFTVDAPTLITVTVPVGATSGTVKVTTPGGTATSTSTFTVDASSTNSPASTIDPLPATSSPSFTVAWSGTDAGGPGIASYEIFVNDNGGSFTPFLTNTKSTSATFNGNVGHSYGFYSIATDNAGNVQSTPNAAQAITMVVAGNSTISGTVFQDYNLDGQQDGGEPGLAGQIVSLYQIDNGVLNQVGSPSTTNANGAYSFTSLVPGNYSVRLQALGGAIVSMPSIGSYSVTINGSDLTNQDFADVLTSITVPLTLPPNTAFPAQGTANADYVEAVYRAVLDRNADSGGLSWWTGNLNGAELSRLQVVQGIRNSPEHFGQEIDVFYATLLGRAADPQGRAYWVKQLENGTREEQIAFDFLDSPEYLSKGDKYFVDAMYLSLLGRSFDATGEAYWLNELGDDSSGAPTHAAALTHCAGNQPFPVFRGVAGPIGGWLLRGLLATTGGSGRIELLGC